MNIKLDFIEYSINIDNRLINYKSRYNAGSNEVIVFIHGLACSSDSFRNLSDHNYFPDKSLLCLDLIGFGKSSKDDDFSYSMEDQANVLKEFLSIIPQSKIHIVAHSMGCAIALLLKQDFYSRILSFSNIEGNLISEDCGLLSRGITSISYDKYKNDLFEKQLNEFKNHDQLHFQQTTPLAVYKSASSLVKWSESGELLDKFINLNCRKCYFYGEQNKN